ncbi:GPW/gp25 family protein [Acuticoccus sp. M5D2P5]|uniref:GPW/gp25 family protein n=1 Tax=Acuticoccus kalidii TaxID=2910977 RepID=UPI001F183EC6|nr:GPW/gp25 family protein [Acuticoccus kalidii]MCF3935008.1 GPW/gp25 family protein [Acuticoccus kalidii]
MLGLDSTTFQPLSGPAHLKQSIADLFRTRIGERVSPGDVIDNFGQTVSIREYGTKHHRLVDEPLNSETILAIIIDVYDALMRWDPRVLVKSVRVAGAAANGEIEILIDVIDLESGQELLTIPVTL